MTFPPMNDISAVTNDTSADANARARVMTAIWTAVETPGTTTTSSLDLTALTVEQLIRIIDELQQQGYGVTSASTGHITVTWQPYP